MKQEQIKWFIALLCVVVVAVSLSVPPVTKEDRASRKAFTEVGDWMHQHFGDSWWIVIGLGIALVTASLVNSKQQCQWTLLGVASISGLFFTLLGSDELSANEFRGWCLFNAGVVAMALKNE
jgi:energy-converting hydrogenase Eha subunit A